MFLLALILALAFAALFVIAFMLLVAGLRTIADELEDAELACVECGCTALRGCPGGCAWVSLDPPLCTSCA